MLDDIGMKFFFTKDQRNGTIFLQLNVYGTSSDHMLRSGISDVNNAMDLERAIHKKCYQIPMAAAQRLISSMMRRFYGCLWGLTGVIPDTE